MEIDTFTTYILIVFLLYCWIQRKKVICVIKGKNFYKVLNGKVAFVYQDMQIGL